MQTPNYADGQFATAALLNTAQSYVTASLKDVAGGLFTPGLLNPSSLSFTFSNSLSVNIIAPAPFRLLTSSGVLASAHGTLAGVNSDVATVNFSSLVPSSGSVTAYIVASTLQIGQNSVAVIGPPIGHPDYNPANAPFSFYTNLQDSIAFTATTTAPDNITYYEVARVTLTAGQTSITSLEYNDVIIARPVQAIQVYAGNPNGNIGGTQGASGVQPSIVWDTADELLWVCTTTGTTTTAAWTACAQLNGLSNQTFLVASATPGTNQAVPINQADGRYAAINGSASEAFNVSAPTNPATTPNQSLNASNFPSSLGGSGWKKYPDPNSPSGYFIEQWGLTTQGGLQQQSVNFPIAFPNACLNVVATLNDNTTSIGGLAVYDLTTTFFAFAQNYTGGQTATYSIYWMAKGY